MSLPAGGGYLPSHPKELERLKLQASFVEDLDQRALALAGDHLGRRPLVVVDVGCADGSLTRSRFAGNEYSHVVGIDADPVLVEAASAVSGGSKFHFLHVDVESSSLEEVLGRYFSSKALPGPDIIFSALMLPHLSDPVEVLSSARRALCSPGALVVRGSDDGSKMAWPDYGGVVPRIVDLTRYASGVGDRMNGRKIFSQLRSAGFADVKMLYHAQDTVGLSAELRAALFRDSFSFRVPYLERSLEASDLDLSARLEYLELIAELEQLVGVLEGWFADEEFYYVETSFAGVAFL